MEKAMRLLNSTLTGLCSALLLAGCAVGYDSVLFMTKSNIGIDVDGKPPTAEVSIARREVVIAPRFEGGQTPPVVASFRAHVNPFSRFFFGVQSTFAGGDAAVALSQESVTNENSQLCLSKKPDPRTILGRDVSLPEAGQVDPFFFATDTTFGLKLAWSGTTGQFPDTVRLGFSRKEFAWAPLIGNEKPTCTVPGTNQPGSYAVWMPAFLAVLDNDVQVGTPNESKTTWLQYFATGTSATNLAKRPQIRNMMMARIDPAAFESEVYGDDPTVKCIEEWLKSDKTNPAALQTWWKEKKLQGFATLNIKTKAFRQQREDFIKEKQIPCNP